MEDIDEIKSNIREKVNSKEDKIILFKVLDKINESLKDEKYTYTNFLNMSQIDLIKKYISYKYMYICGGLKYNERNLIILSNKEIIDTIGVVKENISCMKIEYFKYEQKSNISHRDVLGSILSLGIERELIGDIYVNNENAYVIVKKSISDLLIQNITKIKNISVKVKEVIQEEIDIDSQDGDEKKILVTSMRLDNILSSTLKMSRSSIDELIDEKKVFINWKNEIKRDKMLKIGDVISIRGIGRIVIKESIGTSKKGKISLNIIEYR